VLLHADWRPILGLTDSDQGSLIERVLALAVIGEAVEQHNKSIAKANT
jgi:hypothetical protein